MGFTTWAVFDHPQTSHLVSFFNHILVGHPENETGVSAISPVFSTFTTSVPRETTLSFDQPNKPPSFKVCQSIHP